MKRQYIVRRGIMYVQRQHVGFVLVRGRNNATRFDAMQTACNICAMFEGAKFEIA